MRQRQSRRTFIASLLSAALGRVGAAEGQASDPVVGILSTRSATESGTLIDAFQQGLTTELGGEHYSIEGRWADGDYGRLPSLAADLLRHKLDLLFAPGGEPSALAAKAATKTIPIVFIIGGDAVKLGLVESYARPGGNATGFSILTSLMEAKRLEVLNDLLPNARVLGVLVNPKLSNVIQQSEEVQDAAKKFGHLLELIPASTDADLDHIPDILAAKHVDALLVTADPFFDIRQNRIIAEIAQSRLPAIYQSRSYALAGGLISYGISFDDVYRQAGVYAGRILHGTDPGVLPVAQPTKFELVINLKTARAAGIEVPELLRARATDIIE